MNNIFVGVLILLIAVAISSMAVGVNLKDWFGWVQVTSNFLLGIMIGQNMIERLIIGIVLAAMTMWIGPIVLKRQNR